MGMSVSSKPKRVHFYKYTQCVFCCCRLRDRLVELALMSGAVCIVEAIAAGCEVPLVLCQCRSFRGLNGCWPFKVLTD